MKIVKFEVVHVRPRYSFLRLHTDDGIVGIGEACLEGKARVVQAALGEFEELLVGQDPRRIEHLWHLMYRSTFYPSGSILCSAISAIDQALWDILGKHLGVPVHVLLGGAVRDRVRVYQHVNAGDWEAFDRSSADAHIEELTAKARAAVAAGFTMIKTALPGPARPVESRGFVKLQVERFAALRDAVGDDVDIAIDFHGRVSPAVAKVLIAELAPLSPLFVEEPCLPENVPAMAEIARSTTVPIATGERLFTRWGFRELLESRAAAVLQPDLAHCGGISEARKIAAMGETYFAALAPHNPLGPVNLAASVHLALTVPGFLAQEQLHLGPGLVTTPFEVVDGHVAAPTGPGLGVELLPEPERAEEDFDGGWTLPVWHTADGAVAPW
ncbi:galactonate dehydratase [Pseudonocardia zijingensis]|uniref:Galactonate dehydratase n=1 Tax=Pseudonocardia zijingensis TaxID=153376 RepID=A0ABN1PS44_9PSEU